MDETLDRVVGMLGGRARFAVVLGSGLSALERFVEIESAVSYRDVPSLAVSTVRGHPGKVALCRIAGSVILLFFGRPHIYEGFDPSVTGAPLEIASACGCRRILLTHAAGGLHGALPVGSWILPDDIVSLPSAPLRALRDSSIRSARATAQRRGGLCRLVSGRFRTDIARAAAAAGVTVHGGVLCWNPGPSYETPAEAEAALLLGADAVTMSSLPELLSSGRGDAALACLGWITNSTANVSRSPTRHDDIIERGAEGSRDLLAILERLLSLTDTV